MKDDFNICYIVITFGLAFATIGFIYHLFN